jgi:hypothetical protein
MFAAWLSLVLWSPHAVACGGPDWADVRAAMRPGHEHVLASLYPWEEEAVVPVTRFLHGLRPTDPALYTALDEALIGAPFDADPGGYVGRATAAMRSALAAGDLDAARVAAEAAVEAIMDLPSPLAGEHGPALRLAVEFIEVRRLLTPSLSVAAWFSRLDAPPPDAAWARVRHADLAALPADPRHPRAASIRWRQLQEALRVGIPDGWSPEDLRAAAPQGFGALQAQLDAWLRDFPRHSLADLARLKKVRLHYLAGEDAEAWALLLELYPRHPARVANELRFLIRQGHVPSDLDLAAHPDALAASLAPLVPWDPAAWDTLWTRATAPSAWGLAAQERLLLAAVTARAGGHPLPAAFPSTAAAPSETWARLRLGALLADGRDADALAQLALLPDDALMPPIRANLHLRAGDLAAAAATPGLDVDAARYLLRILATDAEVEALIDHPVLGWDARVDLATRRLAVTGDWAQGAALLDPVDPERAARWREAGRLSANRSPAGLLATARFLRANAGELFIRADYDERVWYRALPSLTDPTPDLWPDQPERAAAWLRRSFATWRALQAYAAWLATLDVDRLRGRRLREARAVLDEADAAYNLLLNYGSWDGYAWGAIVRTSDEAHTIRTVGAALRARLP